jgi:hypothetical protein
MINFDSPNVQKEFEEAFGFPITNLNAKQIWFLVKLSKHVRGRCRNNSAFNNYFSRIFTHANFREVHKEYKGRSYMGLNIVINGETFNPEDNEE